MTTIKCSVEGCLLEFYSREPLSPNAKFLCREHTPKNEDKSRFQSHQFDKGLKRAAHPIGTTHIKRQGELEDSDEDREIWSKIQAVTKEK